MSLVEASRDTRHSPSNLSPQSTLDDVLGRDMADILARNRALVGEQFLQSAGWAFDTRQRHSSVSDARRVIAPHRLQDSPSVESSLVAPGAGGAYEKILWVSGDFSAQIFQKSIWHWLD